MNSTFESQDKIYNTGLTFPTTALLTGPSTVALHKAFNLMAKVRSSIILLYVFVRRRELPISNVTYNIDSAICAVKKQITSLLVVSEV